MLGVRRAVTVLGLSQAPPATPRTLPIGQSHFKAPPVTCRLHVSQLAHLILLEHVHQPHEAQDPADPDNGPDAG